MLNGELVLDLWRSEQGQLLSLGRDIDPRQVLPVLAKAAPVMRQQLHERGDDDLPEIDADLMRLTVKVEPRLASELLHRVVYAMAERLRAPGDDAVVVKLGSAQPSN